MSEALLVSPVRVCRPGAEARVWDRAIPSILRAGTKLTQSLLGSRGIGFGCTVAANLIGAEGHLAFQLSGGGSFSVRNDDKYWLKHLLLDRNYEPDLDHFLDRALTAKDSFLDCGANLGLWSIAASRVIAEAERVVAVEAGTGTFLQLKRNWEANSCSFTILHRAIGNLTGEQVRFFASVGDHAAATIIEGLSPDDAQEELVTTISLPDLVNEQLSRQAAPDALIFVKLDIEGMERQVFSTLEPDRDGNLVVLYEDHGSETDHVTAFVLDCGFHAVFLGDDGTLEPIRNDTIDRLDELKTNPCHGYNLAAYAAHGAAASRMAELFGLHLE